MNTIVPKSNYDFNLPKLEDLTLNLPKLDDNQINKPTSINT